MSETLLAAIQEYLQLVVRIQLEETLSSSFDQGYFFSVSYPELLRRERLFLNKVPALLPELLAILEDESIANERRVYILHLLGWAQDYIETPLVLMKYIQDSDVGIGNAALRSLFPMVASGKFELPINEVLPLIYQDSPYIKNKALGILAFTPKSQNEAIRNLVDKDYLKGLLNVKEEMVQVPAKLLFEHLGLDKSL